jgi:hypothetical protein
MSAPANGLLSNSFFPTVGVLDQVGPAAAAFSLRKLRQQYNGPAIRVRRSSDNSEADIGFDANGDLDLDALTNHCQSPRRPLDVLPSSVASYSLRKLRSAYNGQAIRVRRSLDNAEIDIGFATSVQTRTNLAVVPASFSLASSSSAPGVTISFLGNGTEFGMSYSDMRFQGTATAAGFLTVNHG